MTTKLKVSDIQCKLPDEAQNWIKMMNSEDLHTTETILNNVGEASFLENWQMHKEDWDEFGVTKKYPIR
jgi:hypothetical protein